tara:strand:- start:2211 stop:2585 length:375 start_codon:yes stop_codon:yes gene_type:complete
MRLNSIVIGGNLCADPESKDVAGGHVLTTFRIANNHGQDKVSFINVECWGKTAETCRQYLEKGSGVIVQGEMIVDTYKDKEGNNRNKAFVKAYKVEFLPRRTEREKHTSSQSQSNNQPNEEVPF